MACLAVLFALTEKDAARVLGARGDEALDALVEEIEGRWETDWLCQLDKAWDGIHRCLTDGELGWDNGEYPLNHAILGGKQLHEEDDYIVTYVSPTQVVDVAKAIQPISAAMLRERYNRINRDSYGAAPTQRGDEDFGYIADSFEELQAFYAKAAGAGRAVLFTVDQ